MEVEAHELLQSLDSRMGRVEDALLGDDFGPGFIEEQRQATKDIKTEAAHDRRTIEKNRRSIAWMRGIGSGVAIVLGVALGAWEYARRI